MLVSHLVFIKVRLYLLPKYVTKPCEGGGARKIWSPAHMEVGDGRGWVQKEPWW